MARAPSRSAAWALTWRGTCLTPALTALPCSFISMAAGSWRSTTNVREGSTSVTLRMQLPRPHRCRCLWPHHMEVNGELYVVGTIILQGSTYLSQVYKSNVFAMKLSWTRVENVGDLTLLMSSNFTAAGYGGAVSVSVFKRNSAYCLAFNSDRDQFEWEIIDIANGTSEFQCPKNILGSGALCWIQPNHWA